MLQELEALDGERRITSRGRAMARLPLDPPIARLTATQAQRYVGRYRMLDGPLVCC